MSGRKKGFTLVELAIVLVIIGLLVGGVLQGQELIYQAQLKKVVTQFTTYKTAANTFRSKYNQLPGDLRRATTFLGACDLFTFSCNGNGSGDIGDNLTGSGEGAGERWIVWRHLSLAGLLAGNYQDNTSMDTYLAILQLPGSDKNYLEILRVNNGADFNGLTGVNVIYAAYGTGTSSSCNSVGDLDNKIDDGKYNAGIMRIDTSFGDGCSNTASTDGSYFRSRSGMANFMIKSGI